MRVRVAVVVGLVAVVVIGLVIFVRGGDDDTDATNRAERPPYRVLEQADASAAVEGGDFNIVQEVAPRDGEAAIELLPDGRLVVYREAEKDFSTYYYLDLVDPVSGEREALPAPWIEAGPETFPALAVLADDRLLFSWSDRERGARQDRVMVLDLASGDREEFDLPAPPLEDGAKVLTAPMPAGDGRLYFQTGRQLCGDGECSSPRGGRVWSFAPGDRVPRREMAAVRFVVSDDLLAWTDDAATGVIHVRDLSGGGTHRYAVGGLCVIAALVASADLVVVACPNQERQVVVDAEARPVVDLRLTYEQPTVGNRWVLASSFAYDTRTGQLLRLFETRGPDFIRALDGDRALVPLGRRWAVVELS